MASTESAELLHLFDLNWFTNGPLNSNTITQKNPLHQIQEIKTQNPNPRSLSEQSLDTESSSSFPGSDTLSPSSVLLIPNPHFPSKKYRKVERKRKPSEKCRRRRRRGGREGSKSLSELEFEELKGFMDLGFVFDEEELDSRLVSIVPGLQRLGEQKQGMMKKDDDKNEIAKRVGVSRPYLSEAWDSMERRDPVVVDLRVKDLSDEIEVKNRLRVWAHSVASAIRV